MDILKINQLAAAVGTRGRCTVIGFRVIKSKRVNSKHTFQGLKPNEGFF